MVIKWIRYSHRSFFILIIKQIYSYSFVFKNSPYLPFSKRYSSQIGRCCFFSYSIDRVIGFYLIMLVTVTTITSVFALKTQNPCKSKTYKGYFFYTTNGIASKIRLLPKIIHLTSEILPVGRQAYIINPSS